MTAYLDMIEMAARGLRDRTAGLFAAIARETDRRRPLAQLAGALRWSQAAADLVARANVIGRRLAVADHAPAAAYAAEPAALVPEVPRVPFLEAIADLLGRVAVGIRPELADRARVVAEVYSERHGFALARIAEEWIAERVRDKIGDLLKRGVPETRAGEEIAAEAPDLTEAYARTVYRTNVATAYRAGQMREAADPVTRRFLPAFRYETAGDVSVRGHPANEHRGEENHWALHGLVARTDSPTWGRWSPPGGWNCRCDLRLMDREEIAERGISADIPEPAIPAAARFHDLFGLMRPDVELYGRVTRS